MRPSTLVPRLSLFSLTTVFALATMLCASMNAAAQAGQLDSSFAKGGIFATANNLTTANAIAIQSDGKIVIAGAEIVNNAYTDTLIRLNTDGSLDTSFGTGGVDNITPPGSPYAVFGFFGLAIQSDGKIVAAADAANTSGLIAPAARVETNGSRDTSFGSGGFTSAITVPVNISGNIALQADGKVLLAAGTGNPSVMARFTTSGQFDTNFGGGSGLISLTNAGPTQIAEEKNGKILVASGEASKLVFQPQPVAQAGSISRYNSNGTVDTTFGAGGTAASVASASALLLQANGDIVVAGAITSKLSAPPAANDVGFGIVRYSGNGMIDKKFGTGGVAMVDLGPNAPTSAAYAVALQTDGALVVAGAAGGAIVGNNLASSFGLARFTSAGVLDSTFGSSGTVITTVASGQYSWVTGLAIQSDGKIVASGTSKFSNFNDNAYVARYLAQ